MVNGLEGIVLVYNDVLLVFDEMGEVDLKEVGDVVYMFVNG